MAQSTVDCSYIKGKTTLNQLELPTCYGYPDGSISVASQIIGLPTGLSITYYFDFGMPQSGNGLYYQVVKGGKHTIVTENTIDGCRDTLVINMPDRDSISVTTSIERVTCDELQGSFTAIAKGGTGVLDLSWNTTPILIKTPTINNIASGETRTITVIDENGCEVSKTLTMPAPLPLSVNTDVLDSRCFGDNSGSIALTPLNGFTPYSYKWTGPNGAPNTAITAKIENLKPGTYSVTVNDGKICSFVGSFDIKEAAEIIFDEVKIGTASCQTTTDGHITVKVVGGTAPYNYLWSNGATTPRIENLSGGNYKILVNDAIGCKVDSTIKVALQYPYTTTKQITSTTCHDKTDGTAEVNPLGGTNPFKYQWSDGKSQVTNKAIDLAAGLYYVTTTDAYGCLAIDTVVIGKPDELKLTLVATPVTCHDSNDGSITATYTGGNGNVLYTWCDGQTTMDKTKTLLKAGVCKVVIRDDKSCVATDSIEVKAPLPLKIDNIIIEPIKCFGDNNASAECIVSGGKPTYSFRWNDPNAQILAKANNLGKGDYKVVVSDANNCSVEGNVNIKEPVKIDFTTEVSSPKCFGDDSGNFTILPKGGTPKYSIKWTNGALNDTTFQLDKASAGVYQFTLTDGNGCKISDSLRILAPEKMLLELEQTQQGCHKAGTNILAIKDLSGGTPGYQYEWNNGSTNQMLTNISAAKYTLTVTDANLCTVVADYNVKDLDSIYVELAFVKPTCNGAKDGQIAVTFVSGGIGTAGNVSDYTYYWDSTPQQFTALAEELAGGRKYEVVVADGQGCKGKASLLLGQPSLILLKTIATDVKCFEGTDGTAEVTAKGDNPFISYQWNDSQSQTTATATALKEGTYKVVVTDDKGCTATDVAVINAPTAIELAKKTIVNNKCFNQLAGSITVETRGGTEPYNYEWSNKENSNKVSELKAGSYTLTITDKNACKSINAFVITEPDPIEVTANTTDVTCFDLKDGTISIKAKGGTAPYKYSADGAIYNGRSIVVGLRAGNYNVYVKDINDCINDATVTVSQPDKFELEVIGDTTLYYGLTAPLATSYKNNVGEVRFEWTAPSNDWLSCLTCPKVDVKAKTTSTIYVKAKDENNCKAEAFATIKLRRDKSVFVPTGFSPNNDKENDVLMIHGKNDVKVSFFRVFDRWGEMLFEAKDFQVNDPNIGWDGTYRGANMPAGSYVWFMQVEYPNGEKDNEKGSSMLLR